jgi:hypothetical protein
MIRDTSLILQMQLAIMGIVLVFGLFYLWRSTSRLEEKIDVLAQRIQGITSCKCPGVADNDITTIDPEEAEEFMKHVFGGDMMFVPQDMPLPAKQAVVEEIPADVPTHAPEPEEVDESEADTDAANPLSKSKLKRMNVDTLKALCEERGFSSEGSKTVLMNRLLGLSRE